MTTPHPGTPQTPTTRARNQLAAAQRRDDLLELIRREGSLAVADLAARADTSIETLRRDLRYLEKRGWVARDYGVVRAVQSGVFESTFARREQEFAEEKDRIVREAVSHLANARSIFVDEGYLPSLFAAHIPLDLELTVVTTSVRTAQLFTRHPRVTLIMVGGRMRPNTLGVVDYWATQMLSSLSIDLAFIGANAIDDAGYLSTPDAAVAAVKTAAIKASTRLIVIADHSKFGKSSFVKFAHLSQAEALITGSALRDVTAQRLSAFVPDVVQV